MSAEDHLYLTPKNLYRLLKGTLPGQTLPILAPHSTRGLTLVRFWRDTLTPLLNPSELDKLFPMDGTHPRVQSSLMNRSGSSSLPGGTAWPKRTAERKAAGVRSPSHTESMPETQA